MLSKVIDLGVNRKRIYEFLLVINSNFSRISYTVFEILTFKARKWFVFPTTPPLRGNPLEFLDETYLVKTRGMGVGLPHGKIVMIISSTVFLYDPPV